MSTPQELVDVFPVRLSLEENDSGRVLIRGPFGHCANPTSNGRLYKKPLMEREFKRLEEAMNKRRMFGELDHPQDGQTSLKRVSHIITDLKIESDGTVVGTLEPLPTPMGDILKALAKAGCELGVSSRGRGSIVTRDDGIDEVQDDFKLKTYDVVDNPASKNAFPSVVESEQVSTFLESIDEEHRDDVRQAFESAAAKIDTFTLEDIHDDALRAQVSDALGLDEKPQDGQWIIMKASRATKTGTRRSAYSNPTTTKKAGVTPGKVYTSKSDAEADAKKLGAVNPVGFAVVPMVEDAEEIEEAKIDELVFRKVVFAIFALMDSAPKKKLIAAMRRNSKELAGKMGVKASSIKDAVKTFEDSTRFEGDETDFVDPLEEENKRLKAELEDKLGMLGQDLREELEVTIRAEMLADPEVAAARSIVEQIAGVIRPLFPVGMDDRLHRENMALADAVKARDFDLANAKMAAEKVTAEANTKMLEAHLLSRIAGHPKADAIKKMIGPVARIENTSELDERIDTAFDAMGKPEDHVPDVDAAVEEAVATVSETFEARIVEALNEKDQLTTLIESLQEEINNQTRRAEKKSAALEKAVSLGEELEAARAEQVELREELELRLYAAEKSFGRPDATRLFALCESAESEEEVDRIIATNTPSAELRESVERTNRKARRAVEHRTESAEAARHGARNGGTFLSEGFPVDLAEAAALAGVSSTPRR